MNNGIWIVTLETKGLEREFAEKYAPILAQHRSATDSQFLDSLNHEILASYGVYFYKISQSPQPTIVTIYILDPKSWSPC